MEYFWKIPIFTEAVICLVSLVAKLMYGKCIFMQESLQNHLSGIPCSTSFFEKVDVISFIYTRARAAFGGPAREKFIQSLGLLNQLNRITVRRPLRK